MLPWLATHPALLGLTFPTGRYIVGALSFLLLINISCWPCLLSQANCIQAEYTEAALSLWGLGYSQGQTLNNEEDNSLFDSNYNAHMEREVPSTTEAE